MKNIRLLDNNTINKIAAGEVIERPSSVVKEIVENSIDAGASFITVEIKEGGVSFIKVSDNGSGIKKDEIKTAFLRHATSKMENIEDLESIYSLGFRGEALASIASVSQVELITKTKDDNSGTSIEINGGEVIDIKDIGATDGTSVCVRNLFYNVPARRKFLKKASTESSFISEIINKFALGHPEISFKYINNNTVILHTSGNNDLKTAIFHVYGKETVNKMYDISYKSKDFELEGYIGFPELSRANRTYENLFINGRFVKNTTVSSAIEDAYKTRLLIGKFPVFVLSLTVPPSFVDVNVHPTKLEVRFNDDDEIYNFINKSVLDSFKSKIFIPKAELEVKNGGQIKNEVSSQSNTKKFNSFNEDIKVFENKKELKNTEINDNFDEYKNMLENESLLNKVKPDNYKKVKETAAEFILDTSKEEIKASSKNEEIHKYEQLETNLDEISKHSFFKNYKIIGQVFNTYWIVEQSGSIFLIDQHAAHERILFEELMKKFKTDNIISQRLFQPMVINFTEKEKQILTDNLDLINKFGFEIENFGNNTFALSSVPFIFKKPSNAGFLNDIVDTLNDKNVENIYDTKILSIATIACKAAVKGNDKLSFQEANILIESLLKLDNPFTCPHGRPTIIEMTKYEVEKLFKRIQ